MRAVEERVSILEGRLMEQAQVFGAIYQTLENMNQRMSGLENRMTSFEDRVEVRFAALEQKLDQRFAWLIGIQIATFLGYLATTVALLKH